MAYIGASAAPVATALSDGVVTTTKIADGAVTSSKVATGTTTADPGANGLVARTASGTASARTITAGTGVSVTNGDGVAGNPTITNSGVTSIVAGTGITISGSTGAVTVNSSATAPTTAQVLSATAGASVGAVGTYAFATNQTASVINPGGTIAGSSLRYYGIDSSGGTFSNTVPAGTWRCMGYAGTGSGAATAWLRIS